MRRTCKCSGPCTPPASDVTRREFIGIVGAGAAGAVLGVPALAGEAPAPRSMPGVIEGERMEVLATTGGNTQVQDLAGGWSGDEHLWWTGGKPGDKLDLAVPVAKAGRFKLSVQLTKARDYGIVQLSLDGNKLGEPIDLYNPEVVPTDALNLGAHDLAAGRHTLTLEITGANEKAVKAYMAGVDYVKLEAVPP